MGRMNYCRVSSRFSGNAESSRAVEGRSPAHGPAKPWRACRTEWARRVVSERGVVRRSSTGQPCTPSNVGRRWTAPPSSSTATATTGAVIYRINGALIGADPDRIKPGMQLKTPTLSPKKKALLAAVPDRQLQGRQTGDGGGPVSGVRSCSYPDAYGAIRGRAD